MTKAMTVTQQKALAIRDYLQGPEQMRQLNAALPKWLNADRFLRVAYTALLRNPKLLDCSTQSLLSALIESAQLGLEPVLGKAALIPYGNEAQFQPMYRGLIELARRTAEIKITAHVVYEMDQFDYSYGTDERIVHKPYIDGPRGKALGAYTVWTFASGFQTFLFMPQSEIEEIRDRYSQAYRYAAANPKNTKAQDTPWITRPGEQAKKTVIKNHSKLQPCSIEMERAVELDHLAETGRTQTLMPQFTGFDTIPVAPEGDEEPETGTVAEFVELAGQLEDTTRLDEFIKECAQYGDVTPDEVRGMAVKRWDEFASDYAQWLEKQEPPPETEFKCQVEGCKFKAKSARGLKKHETQQHSGPPDPAPVETPEEPGTGEEPGGEEDPPAEDFFEGAAARLEQQRLRCIEAGKDEKFYAALGQSGSTTIKELIDLKNQQAVMETVNQIEAILTED